MNKPIPCFFAAVLLALAPAAMANDPPETRFYIAPMASYGIFSEDADQIGGQLSIGKNFGEYFAIELYGFYFPGVEFESTSDVDIYGFGASALFFPARNLLPIYAVVGAGVGEYHFEGSSGSLDSADTEFYDLGLGYMFQLNDYGVKLRAEYRYRSANIELPGSDGDIDSNVVSIGIQIPLGPPARAPEPEPAPAPPPDSDGDGVIDRYDQCPGTPAGVKVNANGCPVEKEAPVVLRGVTFEFDEATLTAQAQRRLDNVIAALKASPDVKFSIAGHTDAIGTETYNQALSERRAQSVREYLVEHGISPSRITRVVGYGEARPVATNETAAGRAQNRRVELHVTEQ